MRCGFDPWVMKIPGGGRGNPLQYSCLERTPRTEEPGGLRSMGLQRVRHDGKNFARTHRPRELQTEAELHLGTPVTSQRGKLSLNV